MLHLCVSARVRTRSVAVSPTPKKSLSHTHRTCTLAQGNLLFTEANPWPSTRTNASAATSTSTTPSPERLSHQGWGGRGRGGSLPQTPEIASAGPWPWEKAEYKVTLGDRLKELVAPLHSSRSWPTPGQAAQDAAPVPAAWCVVKRVVRYAVLAPPPVVVYACLSGLFGSKHACLSGLFGCKHARTRARARTHTHTAHTHSNTRRHAGGNRPGAQREDEQTQRDAPYRGARATPTSNSCTVSAIFPLLPAPRPRPRRRLAALHLHWSRVLGHAIPAAQISSARVRGEEERKEAQEAQEGKEGKEGREGKEEGKEGKEAKRRDDSTQVRRMRRRAPRQTRPIRQRDTPTPGQAASVRVQAKEAMTKGRAFIMLPAEGARKPTVWTEEGAVRADGRDRCWPSWPVMRCSCVWCLVCVGGCGLAEGCVPLMHAVV